MNSNIQAINEATDAFKVWGEYYTMDCNKVKRDTDDKWFDRNVKHLRRLQDRSLKRLKC